MNRIHEAIGKAAQERRQLEWSGTTSIEEILSTSYEIAGGVAGYVESKRALRGDIAGALDLSRYGREPWKPDEKKMLFASDAADAQAREQFRLIRTKLYQLREQRRIGVIAIVSALQGEGKTFVAANLAHALTLHGEKRVLLVDADLRRGSLAEVLGARGNPGLSEMLRDGLPLEAAVQKGLNGALYLLPSGRRVQEPGELICSSRMEELLHNSRPAFDWIVIDTPPVTQFADAGDIASLCDGVLMVFSCGVTPLHLARRAIQEMSIHVILGAILNRKEYTAGMSKYFAHYENEGALSAEIASQAKDVIRSRECPE
jgi:capsular exopolysaccharide synthesis family protein